MKKPNLNFIINCRMVVLFTVLMVSVGCSKKTTPLPPVVTSNLAIQQISPLSGTPGTLVTITGKGFNTSTAGTALRIGAAPVSIYSINSTQITLYLPPGITPGLHEVWVRVALDSVKYSGTFEIKPQSAFVSNDQVPVSDQIVNSCFYGVGLKDVHPRLLFSNEDIERIKNEALTDNFLKSGYDDIIAQANSILTQPILDYGLDGANLRIPNIHKFSNDQAPYLVLAYQFTKDTRYALRCWQQLDKMCNYPDWGAQRHFLDAGIAAKAIAICYDGLYGYLSDIQRTRLVTAVKNFVLIPGKNQINGGASPFKWWLTDDNWNGICHGGMIMAALATFETDPAFNSSIIALCANGTLKYMESLAPDGASEEGMSYWAYGLSNTFLAFESMKRVLSTTYGLAEQPGFRKTGWFPYLVSGPAGTATFGDDYLYVGQTNKFLSYNWFARYFNDANLAQTHYSECLKIKQSKANKMNGWHDVLFYSKALITQGSTSTISPAGYMRGVEYAWLQENTEDVNRLYAGIHGGANNASHGHLDAGSFFIQANGENFAVGNLGREDPYPGDYFTVTQPTYQSQPTSVAATPGRFYYYRIRTESKNCMVFAPDARPEQNPEGVSAFTSQVNDASGGYVVLDLASCYSRDVSHYKRGIKLNRENRTVTIQDEFTPTTEGPAYWLMHSPSTDGIVISPDGKQATMTKNGKKGYLTIQSPQDAVFTVVHRSETSVQYLSETGSIFSGLMTGKNSINKWYGKLQIKLTSTSKGKPETIRVDFSPTGLPAFSNTVKLEAWTTKN